jgi:NADH-quinone oxidoreductase subunit A
MMEGFLPILIFIIFSLLFAGGTVLFSFVFGLKKSNPTKLSPYECGVPPSGEAHLRFAIKFFIVAVLFLIFDVEGLTLFPWAVIYKKLGAFGLIEMGIFIAILFAGLVYIWRKGGLIWE